MRQSFLTAVAGVCLAVLAQGCASQCDTVCNAYNACTDLTVRPRNIDCFNYCPRIDDFNARASTSIDAGITDACAGLWQEHLACWTQSANLANICTRSEPDGGFPCGPTGTAYRNCMVSYCRGRTPSVDGAGTTRWDDEPFCRGSPNFNACSASAASPGGCTYCVIGSGDARQRRGTWTATGWSGAGPAVDTVRTADGGAQGAPLVPQYSATGAFSSYGPPVSDGMGGFVTTPRINQLADGGTEDAGVFRINLSNTCTDPYAPVTTTVNPFF